LLLFILDIYFGLGVPFYANIYESLQKIKICHYWLSNTTANPRENEFLLKTIELSMVLW